MPKYESFTGKAHPVGPVPGAGRRRRGRGRDQLDRRAPRGPSPRPRPADPRRSGRGRRGADARPGVRPLCDGQHAARHRGLLRRQGRPGAGGMRDEPSRPRSPPARPGCGGPMPGSSGGWRRTRCRRTSRWSPAPPRRRCSTPTGSSRSRRIARASPPCAPSCSRCRRSSAASTTRGPTAPFSRTARPTATDSGVERADEAVPRSRRLPARRRARHKRSPRFGLEAVEVARRCPMIGGQRRAAVLGRATARPDEPAALGRTAAAHVAVRGR